MTSNISQYILERVDDQIKWHYAVASKNKKKYELFQIITIVAGSIVPLINVIDFLPVSVRVVSAGLGSLITIITSVSQLKKYGENWFLYRKTGESLKREKFLFLHDAGEYSDKDEKEKNKVFVQKIEGLLQQESEMAPKQEAKGKA